MFAEKVLGLDTPVTRFINLYLLCFQLLAGAKWKRASAGLLVWNCETGRAVERPPPTYGDGLVAMLLLLHRQSCNHGPGGPGPPVGPGRSCPPGPFPRDALLWERQRIASSCEFEIARRVARLSARHQPMGMGWWRCCSSCAARFAITVQADPTPRWGPGVGVHLDRFRAMRCFGRGSASPLLSSLKLRDGPCGRAPATNRWGWVGGDAAAPALAVLQSRSRRTRPPGGARAFESTWTFFGRCAAWREAAHRPFFC